MSEERLYVRQSMRYWYRKANGYLAIGVGGRTHPIGSEIIIKKIDGEIIDIIIEVKENGKKV